MAANKDMSDWIKFFTAAGIPPGPAAKYALVFIDNRIQKSMLMDLTKEYLKEMGISIMGDVIAILKYAKTAHMRYENERPAITSLATNPDAKVELKRQTTPGNRMLEHYMRKEGIMEGGSSTVTVSPSMAVRLGAVPTGGTKKVMRGSGETAEVVPVKRTRMVKPEEEGKYIVSMPKGITPKTQKILEQKQQQHEQVADDKKSSVFARLGSGNGSPSSPSTQPVPDASPPQPAGGSSVFKRLGGQRKRVVSDDALSKTSVEYRGVLKASSPSAQMTTPKATVAKVANPTTMKVTPGASRTAVTTPRENLQARLGAPSSTPKRTGIPSTGAKSLQARLGAPPLSKTKSVAAPTVGAKQKVTVTIGGAKKSTPGTLRPTMMDRLGVQKPEVSTTTHMDAVGVKYKVLDRLGGSDQTISTAAKGTVKLSTGKPVVKRSMQARLGAPAQPMAPSGTTKQAGVKQTVTVTLGGRPATMQNRLGMHMQGDSQGTVGTGTQPSAGSKLLKRLGSPMASAVPNKKSNVQKRLGVMRAEVSSTTPGITMRMGGAGGGVGRKMTKRVPVASSPGMASKKDVFSRLGS